MNVFDCKEPKEHSTAYKVGRGELKWRILVESCFVYKGAFCECGQFFERRKMSRLEIQATSFSAFFKRFPGL